MLCTLRCNALSLYSNGSILRSPEDAQGKTRGGSQGQMGAQWPPKVSKSQKGQSDLCQITWIKEVNAVRNSCLAGKPIGGLLTSGCELLLRIACFCIFF